MIVFPIMNFCHGLHILFGHKFLTTLLTNYWFLSLMWEINAHVSFLSVNVCYHIHLSVVC